MSPDDPHRRHAATPVELKAIQEMQRSGRAFVTWRGHASGLNLRALDPAASRTTIGRSAASAIALTDDAATSSLHAEIMRIDEEWLIVDDGLSTNGTFVAGRRIQGRTRLRNQDRILVGGTVLVFHSADSLVVRTTRAGHVIERSELSESEFLVLKALCRPIVLGGARSPAPNAAIKDEVFLTLHGVKRCLTRLFQTYGISESASKRAELADAAIDSGIVGRHSYV
jgi:pSer/pThr/pTyr-binding forkhead associated (FHA) protein